MAPPRGPGFLRYRSQIMVDVDIGYSEDQSQIRADHAVYISSDGNRRKEELLNISHKKRRLNPRRLNDTLARWIPVDDSLDGFRTEDADKISAVPHNLASSAKRKRYTSSDDPMAEWRPLKQFFLDEAFWDEGLGYSEGSRCCEICKVDIPVDAHIFKCMECGVFQQCQHCCLASHALSPLHRLKRWTGAYWGVVTLRNTGLVYQLGHGGHPCMFPSEDRPMTVIHTNGIHQVRYRYCKCERGRALDDNPNLSQLMRNRWYPATVTDPTTCGTYDVLDLFRLLNVVGNMNCHDFMGSLERLTDPAGSTDTARLTLAQDRYKQFVRMSRQYAFVDRCMEAGRGHDPAGVVATKLGELIPKCWSCPHDGRNLPPNWRDVEPAYKFLYMLIIALDANFKLRNRLRANEINDPSLGPGWGAFVEPIAYREHLKNYVAEKDVSTCIAFAALLQKDTRMTTGLRVSGVGGCVCARHECMLPNGLGDLQKGERYIRVSSLSCCSAEPSSRYANMDYILMSAIAAMAILALTISYDIACQWKKKLPDRNSKLDPSIQLDLDKTEVHCGLPVWHAASHEKECQDKNTLSFVPGVGKSDGEGVERFWSDVGPAAYHTKDMGLGSRADALEDKIQHHNKEKNLGQGVPDTCFAHCLLILCLGDALRRKLIVAVAERDRQVEAFREVSSTISRDLQHEWRAQIAAFLEERISPTPIHSAGQVRALLHFARANVSITLDPDRPTEAQTRLELKADEEAEARKGTAPVHGTSVTAFLVAGLQLEDAQRRILAEVAGLALMTADREGELQERRIAMISKLRKFRNLQKLYTPGAIAALERDDAARDSDAPPVAMERVKLYLPSELTGAEREHGCQRGVGEMEGRLRLAQCGDALANIRCRLHAKRFLILFRDGNITGQVRATKSRTLLQQVGDRVTASAQKYTQARAALVRLNTDAASYTAFKELKQQDLSLDGHIEDVDAAASKKLKMIAAGKGKRTPHHVKGSSKQVMSWIWTAEGATGSEEEQLHESMQIEWSRVLARKERWTEEVMILREEMRRVLRYLEWQSAWWEAKTTSREEQVCTGLHGGLAAYAARQAAFHRRLAAFFKTQWSTTAGAAASRSTAAIYGFMRLDAKLRRDHGERD
ncbi:hypothetical protein C8R46DRAFT_1160195 [Mycena filopes]|nr:hypothetical protein C8R46DRAFT_1160195 [Mycena filopes]